MTVELTEDEVVVLNSYRLLKKEHYGDLTVSVHDDRLSRLWRTVKENVPSTIREVASA